MDGRTYPLFASHDLYRIDDRYCVGVCHHQAMQWIEARRTAGKIANGYQHGSVSTWDVVGISYSVSALVRRYGKVGEMIVFYGENKYSP